MFRAGRSRPTFSWDSTTGKLRITTSIMTMVFQNGVVVGLGDHTTNEMSLDSNTTINPPASWLFFNGISSTSAVAAQASRVGGVANAAFTSSGNVAQITYTPTNATLVYDFEVDGYGEIIIKLTGTDNQSGMIPNDAMLPIMNWPHDVISGSYKIALGDADYYSPNPFFVSQEMDGYSAVVVLERSGVAFGAWIETTAPIVSSVKTYHYQNSHNHVVLYNRINPETQENDWTTIVGGPWRFTAQSNWLEIARRWKERYEILYPDVKVLWENDCAWVRDIHATYSRSPTTLARWDNVAALVPPENVLYWPLANLSGEQVVYGDNDHLLTCVRPNAAERDYWITQGYDYKVLGYWGGPIPFTDPARNVDKFPTLIPVGYTQPDDIGYDMPDGELTQSEWEALIDGITVAYNAEQTNLHPGSDVGYDWCTYNYRDACERIGRDALYSDITGVDKDGWVSANPVQISKFAAADLRIFNGKSYQHGMVDCLKEVYKDFPVMSEIPHRTMIPYTFFCWNGGQNYFVTNSITSKLNHPLAVALWGSYLWRYDGRATTSNDPKNTALSGGLPEFVMDDDYQADEFAAYSRARAQLYCDYELFHDLPEAWINYGSYITLAYFRSNTGNMFRCEDRGSGVIVYVEEVPEGDVDRLTYPLA